MNYSPWTGPLIWRSSNHFSFNIVLGAGDISSVAVCAGSGGSVLRNVAADLYVTGEMTHHEVLHAVYNDSSVILCDHSNTERGYLTVLKAKLDECLNSKTNVVITEIDCDPLKIV